MIHGDVDELGDVLSRRGLADEQPDLLKGVGNPREEDQQRDEHGADGVQVPHEAISDDGHDQAKDIDGDVVSVIDEEDVDRWVLAVDEAVAHQASLGKDLTSSQPPSSARADLYSLTGDTDKHQRDDLQLARFMCTPTERATRLDLASV